jgi:4-hydroxy-tetrahydrodipicolinate reductase
MIKIAVNGAAGRMGQALVRLIAADPDVTLVAALEDGDHPRLGEDAGRLAGIEDIGLVLSPRLTVTPEVMLDFSTPTGTLERLDLCTRARINIVIGTTGFTDEQMEQVMAASHETAVLVASNMSLGMNLLQEVAAQVARALGDDFDLEIVEAHHRFKADAPSGTALTLAKAICEATGRDFERSVVFGRYGRTGERPNGQIAIHAVRAGDLVGEHRLIFAGRGERVELVHAAHSRDAFARGALRAATFLAYKGAGLYTMSDCLAAAPTEP